MLSSERGLNRLDNIHGLDKEQKQLKTLSDLGLLEVESIPVFDEAAQTAAHFLDAAICILGLADGERVRFKSAVGLSRIGLMNSLATSRQIPRSEAFCAYVMDAQRVLAVEDATAHPQFANSMLVQQYGIRAYLGVPLMASNGECVGTLAIMELTPRQFSAKEISSLELIARWCMSEYERNHFLRQMRSPQPQVASSTGTSTTGLTDLSPQLQTNLVKATLVTQMIQELRTPLTSILGMASVLTREIYGPLTAKQKEYLDIIHNSGQYLLSLVTEILELGVQDENGDRLNLSPVDIEMLCQQSLSTLEQVAERRNQTIKLTVEPGQRIWSLDKEKVRQMLYHIVFNVIQTANAESEIRVHISRKSDRLSLSIWTFHAWLGEGLPQAELQASKPVLAGVNAMDALQNIIQQIGLDPVSGTFVETTSNPPPANMEQVEQQFKLTRQTLGMMLSRQLAELHNGTIIIQGSVDAGYRYVINLPKISEAEPD
jgi:signal transduction histidine kinase